MFGSFGKVWKKERKQFERFGKRAKESIKRRREGIEGFWTGKGQRCRSERGRAEEREGEEKASVNTLLERHAVRDATRRQAVPKQANSEISNRTFRIRKSKSKKKIIIFEFRCLHTHALTGRRGNAERENARSRERSVNGLESEGRMRETVLMN